VSPELLADQEQSFVNAMLGYAQAGELATGVLVSVILAQWANETAWGTSPAFVNGNNPAGISPGGVIARYPSRRDGVRAWIATMSDRDYASVRSAAGWRAQSIALGRSPWAAGHYENGAGDGPGSALVDLITEASLFLYDPPGSVPDPTKEPDMLTSILFAGQLHVFGVDNAGRLVHWWQHEPIDGVFWSTEPVTAGGLIDPQAPSVAVFAEQLHVFAEGDGGTVAHAWQGPGGPWSVEELGLPANQPAAPAVAG